MEGTERAPGSQTWPPHILSHVKPHSHLCLRRCIVNFVPLIARLFHLGLYTKIIILLRFCCCCCCCCCLGLLGTPKEEIERALTVRVVAARKDVVQVKTKLSKAVYARDALAKVPFIHPAFERFGQMMLSMYVCTILGS